MCVGRLSECYVPVFALACTECIESFVSCVALSKAAHQLFLLKGWRVKSVSTKYLFC